MSNAWIGLNLKQFFFIQCEFTALINGTFPSFLFLISWADPMFISSLCVVPSAMNSFSTPSDWLIQINCCITIKKGLKKYRSTCLLISLPPTKSFTSKF